MKKRKQITRITDLSSDILRHILSFVAISSDGAASIARAASVCRTFKELAEDAYILKSVVFDKVVLSGAHDSFWQLHGLLTRSIRYGNLTALNILKEYEEKLRASFRSYNRALFSGRMILMVRARAVETRSTRARQAALKSAIEDCWKLNDAIDVDIRNFMEIKQVLKYLQGC